MSPHSDTLSWFRANPSLLLLINAACLAEKATNTNVIVFGLTRSGLEPTIYRTRGEHANHYTTDAVTTNRAYSQSKMCVILTATKISTNCHVFIFSTVFYWCSLIWNSMPAAITLWNLEYNTCIEILECVCDVIAFFLDSTIHLHNKTLHTLFWHFPIWNSMPAAITLRI